VSGYVVCPTCATRIKAGRAHCLRCGNDLPIEGVEVAPPIWVSLGLSQAHVMIIGGVAAAVVVVLLGVILKTQPVVVDDIAQPVRQSEDRAHIAAEAAPVAEAPAEPTAVATATAYTPPSGGLIADPASVIDSKRNGAAAFSSSNFEAARAAFEQAVAKDPNDADAMNNLGQTLVRLGKVSEAIGRFERAIALAPDKSAFHFNLAHAAGQLGQWDRAIAEYREASKLFPDDYATQYNLGMALHQKGDERGAITEFQKAISLAPGEPSFHLSLGMSLERVGRIADAVKEYKTYLEMEPSAPDAAKLKAHVEALAAGRASRPASAS
jgi:Flp pilus assembly protein TadD